MRTILSAALVILALAFDPETEVLDEADRQRELAERGVVFTPQVVLPGNWMTPTGPKEHEDGPSTPG